MAHPSTRVRSHRTPRIRYKDGDSESDEDAKPFITQSRPSRTARRTQTYRESSGDESVADEVESEPASSILDASAQLKKPSQVSQHQSSRKRRSRHMTRSKASSSLGARKRHKIESSQHGSNSSDWEIIQASTPSADEPIPLFQTLPYQILLNIMQYAAYPLYGPRSQPQPSINWLCGTGRLCHDFQDACTGALLYSPPLYPLQRATGLMTRLKNLTDQPSSRTVSYGARIRYLEIEVTELLLSKNGIALDDLLSLTPQLQGIRFYSNFDEMTFDLAAQPKVKKVRWNYPLDLMRRLESENIILRSFEWNGRFQNASEALKEAAAAHSRPSFGDLHDLSVLNFTLPEKVNMNDAISARDHFAILMKTLSGLRSLSFRYSAMIDKLTMPLLPSGLLSLDFTNCPGLTSEILGSYLSSAGAGLRTLKLNYNQSMSLGFMAQLKTTCANLQHLEIDMNYSDPSAWRARDPHFDELLPQGPPTWPTALVTVSIQNMRQVKKAKAEKFFASLVAASKDLYHLKKLSFKVIVKDASWRDRAELRQKWIPTLEKVFLKAKTPAPVTALPLQTLKSVSHRPSRRIGKINDVKTSVSAATATVAAHATCDVVELEISDQRPSETQFREDDFLDTEPDDDDEYMG